MAHHVFETKAACSDCKATGLYVGMAERDGAAVVCCHCKGTGEVILTLKWDDFESRKRKRGVRRVFKHNPGICIGEGGKFKLEDFGGMPYKDWLAGKPFPEKSENRTSTCPAWWYQTEDYERKPDWEECIGIGSFSRCIHFRQKNLCWIRFDKESAK